MKIIKVYAGDVGEDGMEVEIRLTAPNGEIIGNKNPSYRRLAELACVEDLIDSEPDEESGEPCISEVRIENRTPHEIRICDPDGSVLEVFPKSEEPFRLEQKTIPAGKILGFAISSTQYSKAEPALPEYRRGIFYIVSQLIKTAYAERADLLVPAEIFRDAAGNIIGCKSLGI